MRKEEFLGELEYLLSDVPEDEREEALEYYRDYLEEAGPEHEEEATAHFGSPEKVAAEIKAGLAGNVSGGEFTERGYQDERFREDYHVPDQYAEIAVSSAAGEDRNASDKKDDRPESGDSRWSSENGEQRKDSRWNAGADGQNGASWWDSAREKGRSYQQEWSEWRKEREQRYERDRREQQEQQERDAQRQRQPRWWEYKGPRRNDTSEENRGRDHGKWSDTTWEQREDGTWGETSEWNSGRRTAGDEHAVRRRRNGTRSLILILLFIFIGLPVAGGMIGAGFSVIGSVLGGIMGIFGGIIGLVVAVFAAAFGILTSGIGMIGSGIAHLASVASGLMMIGGGFLLLAVSMLLLVLAKWGCGVAVPWAVHLIRDIVSGICRWIGKCFRKLTGRGDE